MSSCLQVAVLMCLVLGVSCQKQNTTWVFPTLGCRNNGPNENCYPNCPMPDNARCDPSAVCRPTYVKTNFGETLQWTMAALNPSRPGFADGQVFLSRNAGTGTNDLGRPCCGFWPVMAENLWSVVTPPSAATVAQGRPDEADAMRAGVIAPLVSVLPPTSLSHVIEKDRWASTRGAIVSRNLDPRNLNTTWVRFTWNISQQVTAVLPFVTPLYNLTYDAQYDFGLLDASKRLRNNSACSKTVFFRICSAPFWSASPKDSPLPLLGAPQFANPPAQVECGLSKHTPCIKTPGSTVTTNGVQRDELEVGMFDGNTNYGIRVGQDISVNISLSTLDDGGQVMIIPLADPGLPIGAEMSNDMQCGQYTVCRTLTWTPRKGQEGRTHFAHFLGQSMSTLPAALNPCDARYTKETVLSFKVITPESQWVQPVEDVGIFSGDRKVLAAWVGNAVVGTEFNLTLKCMSNYMPKIDMLQGEKTRLELLSTEEAGVGNLGRRVRTYVFGYTPRRGDEGSIKKWVFGCGDDQDVGQKLQRQIAVKTKLCSYSVEAGETLLTMTRRYQLNTNWLNVWNANPMMLSDPDLDLAAGAQVRIGPVYSVKSGDTLKTIAGTTLSSRSLLAARPSLPLSLSPSPYGYFD
jgi:hypothetical protein